MAQFLSAMIDMVDMIDMITTSANGRSDMKRKLSAVEARKHLGEILEGVFYRGDEVVIERAGKPMAVVIPAHLYENIERRRKEFWDLIDKVHERNKDVPFEEIEALVAQEVEAVRKERRENAAK